MASKSIKCTQINLQHCKEATALISRSLAVGHTEIALIQEPYIIKNEVAGLELKGYKIFTGHTSNRPRACIAIRNDIKCSSIPQFCSEDLVTIKLERGGCGDRDLILSSAYLPYDSLIGPPGPLIEQLTGFCSLNKHTLVIACDANSHHIVWGSSDINPRGTELLEFLTSYNLSIHNRGCEPTFVTSRRMEVIDITFGSSDSEGLINNWRVSDEPSLSDHRAIVFELKDITPSPVWLRNPRSTNWELFNHSVGLKMGDINHSPMTSPGELDTLASSFNTIVKNAFEIACPLKKVNTKNNPPWWNRSLNSERKSVRALLRTAISSNNEQKWQAYKHAQKTFKKNIRTSKRTSWEAFCQEIDGATATAKLHKLLAKKPLLGPDSMKTENGYTANAEETLCCLLQAHFGNGRTEPSRIISLDTPQVQRVTAATDIFSEDRIKWAISSFAPFKSGGPDGIFPKMLTESLNSTQAFLQKIFRASWEIGHIPNPWTKVKVVFIPKPGKNDYTSPKSFRPISLSSFLLKTMERLLDRYIRDVLLKDQPISSDQHAFRPGRSTDSALHLLVAHAEDGMNNSGFSLGCFLDIEGAFDNTPFEVIEQALLEWEVDDRTRKWISSMLKNRTLTAELNGSFKQMAATKGCPQGSVISPLLWIMVINSLLVRLKEAGFTTIGFADDLAIIVKGRFASTLCERMQHAFSIVERWCKEKGLTVSAGKTGLMLFTRKRRVDGFHPPKLFGSPVHSSSTVKYLGVTLDPKLNWNNHVTSKIQKTLNTYWALKKAIGSKWGLNPANIYWLYTVVLRPMFCHAAVVWWRRSELFTTRKELDQLQRLALIAITGGLRTTPTRAMEALLNIPPLHLFIKAEARSTFARLTGQGLWWRRVIGTSHTSIENEVDSLSGILCCPRDRVPPSYSFGRPFNLVVRSREEWEGPISPLPDSWFTDGSLIDGRSGAGVYCRERGVENHYSLGSYTSIFHAEIFALLQCLLLIKESGDIPPAVSIYSDSRAALAALCAVKIQSGLVQECLTAILDLAPYCNITLNWIPGHKGFQGNEMADALAKLGAETPIIGPEPTVGVAQDYISRAIQNQLISESSDLWRNFHGQAKVLIAGYKKSTALYLLNMQKTQLRELVGLVTGHWFCNSYLKKIGFRDDPDCDFCGRDEDTSKHFLCDCPYFQRVRLRCFGDTTISPEIIRAASPHIIWSFFKGSKRVLRGFQAGWAREG